MIIITHLLKHISEGSNITPVNKAFLILNCSIYILNHCPIYLHEFSLMN